MEAPLAPTLLESHRWKQETLPPLCFCSAPVRKELPPAWGWIRRGGTRVEIFLRPSRHVLHLWFCSLISLTMVLIGIYFCGKLSALGPEPRRPDLDSGWKTNATESRLYEMWKEADGAYVDARAKLERRGGILTGFGFFFFMWFCVVQYDARQTYWFLLLAKASETEKVSMYVVSREGKVIAARRKSYRCLDDVSHAMYYCDGARGTIQVMVVGKDREWVVHDEHGSEPSGFAEEIVRTINAFTGWTAGATRKERPDCWLPSASYVANRFAKGAQLSEEMNPVTALNYFITVESWPHKVQECIDAGLLDITSIDIHQLFPLYLPYVIKDLTMVRCFLEAGVKINYKDKRFSTDASAQYIDSILSIPVISHVHVHFDRKIGKGNFGTVYMAQYLDRQVAAKLPNAERLAPNNPFLQVVSPATEGQEYVVNVEVEYYKYGQKEAAHSGDPYQERGESKEAASNKTANEDTYYDKPSRPKTGYALLGDFEAKLAIADFTKEDKKQEIQRALPQYCELNYYVPEVPGMTPEQKQQEIAKIRERQAKRLVYAESLREALICNEVSGIANVVPFRGAKLDRNGSILLFDLMEKGSLESVLKADSKRAISDGQLASLLMQAATGLWGLHERSIIHRDVAARNFLMSEAGMIYISDFGLAKKLAPGEEEGKSRDPAPLKWMAPEAIEHGTYSKASDVYMFAIFMWECLARETPYRAMNAKQAASAVLMQGLRPEIDSKWPAALTELMQKCWATDPAERPNMADVHAELQKATQRPLLETDSKDSSSSSSSSSFVGGEEEGESKGPQVGGEAHRQKKKKKVEAKIPITDPQTRLSATSSNISNETVWHK